MIAFVIPAAIWFKNILEKLIWGFLVLYALRYKQNVAAEFEKGKFKLVATGNGNTKTLP